MHEPPDPDIATVIELERRLLQRNVRLDRTALSALLHEHFREVGVSGRVYDRDAIIEALALSDGTTSRAFAFDASRLSDDVMLLTYRTDAPSLRTSIWTRDPGGRWQIVHHQGTPTPE